MHQMNLPNGNELPVCRFGKTVNEVTIKITVNEVTINIMKTCSNEEDSSEHNEGTISTKIDASLKNVAINEEARLSEELQTLVNLRSTLSSVLFMLENSRDDLVTYNERCFDLSESSRKCRQSELSSFVNYERNKTNKSVETNANDTQISDVHVHHVNKELSLTKSKHLGTKSKP